jgi:hypothetical protein
MPEYNKLEEITDNLKEYLLLNFEILKLEATERISVIGASLTATLLIGISVFMFVFTLSIGLGFYISAILGDAYSGFAIIAAFYFLLAIILFVGRKKLIERPLRDKIIEKIANNPQTNPTP